MSLKNICMKNGPKIIQIWRYGRLKKITSSNPEMLPCSRDCSFLHTKFRVSVENFVVVTQKRNGNSFFIKTKNIKIFTLLEEFCISMILTYTDVLVRFIIVNEDIDDVSTIRDEIVALSPDQLRDVGEIHVGLFVFESLNWKIQYVLLWSNLNIVGFSSKNRKSNAVLLWRRIKYKTLTWDSQTWCWRKIRGTSPPFTITVWSWVLITTRGKSR